MRLTRHARRRLAERNIRKRDVESVCRNPHTTYDGLDGQHCFVGSIGGRNLKVVVAADDPTLVITAFFPEEGDDVSTSNH